MRKIVLGFAALAIVAAAAFVSASGQEVAQQKPGPVPMTPALAKEIAVLTIDMRSDEKWEKASKTLEGKYGVNCLPAIRVAHDFSDNEKVQQRCQQLITRIELNVTQGFPSGSREILPLKKPVPPQTQTPQKLRPAA